MVSPGNADWVVQPLNGSTTGGPPYRERKSATGRGGATISAADLTPRFRGGIAWSAKMDAQTVCGRGYWGYRLSDQLQCIHRKDVAALSVFGRRPIHRPPDGCPWRSPNRMYL